MTSNAKTAFDKYENVRGRLPKATFPARSFRVDKVLDAADHFDVFLLDAFGILNIGETAVEGAVDMVTGLRAAGKQVMVLTNGASFPVHVSLEKYHKLGFDFTEHEVVASRDALSLALSKRPEKLWGVMAAPKSHLNLFPVDTVVLADDPTVYDQVDGFIILGSRNWTDARQNMLIASLHNNARPVLVGNPDLVAPREDGLSMQAGWYGHDLADKTTINPDFYGKPFANVFDLAFERIVPDIPKNRIVMVGDTLHTDVLGGAAYGIKTMLVLDHGLFAGQDVDRYIRQSNIVPDWISQRV